jgi:acetyl esterase/lipase
MADVLSALASTSTHEAVDKLFCALADIPVPSGARLLASGDVSVSFTHRDIEKNSKIPYTATYTQQGKMRVPPARDGDGLLAVVPSPSGVYSARFFENLTVEIFHCETCSRHVVDVSSVCSKIFAEDWFSSFEWSSDESMLLFVGNLKTKKSGLDAGAKNGQGTAASGSSVASSSSSSSSMLTDPLWTNTVSAAASAAEKTASLTKKIDDFVWSSDREDFGEQVNGISSGRVFVITLASLSVAVVPFDQDATCCQAKFTPTADGLVFTVIPHTPRRFGSKFCFQRPSHLAYHCFATGLYYFLAVDSKHPTWNARSPFFIHETMLAYTTTEGQLLGHNSCAALHAVTWSLHSKQTQSPPSQQQPQQLQSQNPMSGSTREIALEKNETLIPIVELPDAAQSHFCGLWSHYPGQRKCVVAGHIYFTSPRGVHHTVWCYSVATRQLSIVKNDAVLLDVDTRHGRSLLVSTSTPCKPPSISILQLASDGIRVESEQVLVTFGRHTATEQVLSELEYNVLAFQAPACPVAVETILLRTKQPKSATGKRKLMLIPHGGPHAAFAIEFLPFHCLFALCGFDVLMVNYRGSCNYGQMFCNALIGHIGTMDVHDCTHAIENLLTSVVDGPAYDRRIALCGGSHGGYLVMHLASVLERSQSWKADFPRLASLGCVVPLVIARNPVINIASMHGSTDIPDWTTGEMGVPFSYTAGAPNYAAMYAVSPIANFDKISLHTRIVFLVGDGDRRVPPMQSVEAVYSLRARGIRADMLRFPETDHSLSKPMAEFAGWIYATRALLEVFHEA